ncbi:N-acyl-D-amino-acid deacylase family protein [Sphingosinicella rhizophila]|uniref:D-aminoacylase n=1 Tax=Sphingosinicella rhizophila TaxID=3050082 RepID=A0ABU3Q8S7_9SPHN|nr:D-aminoacylase [Sphingosinicella sp. GR2756]MDT9599813.1 D-aminoacylase [Sphingosinicella sp. GR2756]
MIRSVLKAALCAGVALAGAAASAETYDILIKGGNVIDGTGKPGFAADVGIRAGRIAFVGTAADATAPVTIDARGLAVAPGFIDAHNHMPEEAPTAKAPFLDEQFLTQGVTTVVAGPDGRFSPNQLRPVLDAMKTKGSGTNYACYIGGNGIREDVIGGANRAPTAAELDRMKALVREGMEMGCVGLSTGLMYEPAMFSKTDEIVAMAKEVTPYDGTYDSHTRNPVKDMVGSEKEAIDIGLAARIPPKLGHLKAVGLGNKGRIGDVVSLVEAARAQGVDAVADQYPYDGAATAPLAYAIIFPGSPPGAPLSLAQVQAKLREAIADPAKKAAVRAATNNGVDGGFSWVKAVGYGSMRIVDSPDDPALVDKNLQLLADSRKQDPFDLLAELVLNSKSDVLMTLGSIDEADVQKLMVQPWVMIASDGTPMSYSPHPRSTGSFTRVLGHYSRDLKLFPLEEAVRKMTSLPADHLRLYDRGRIAEGKVADIAIFDPKTVRDRSTYVQPNLLSEGMVHVLVNGQPVIRDGKVTGTAPGTFVARQKKGG